MGEHLVAGRYFDFEGRSTVAYEFDSDFHPLRETLVHIQDLEPAELVSLDYSRKPETPSPAPSPIEGEGHPS